MLFVVGLLVLVPAAGCTVPLFVQMLGVLAYSAGGINATGGTIYAVFFLFGGGTMALGVWLMYLALPRRR
jgi:hypothetical protein